MDSRLKGFSRAALLAIAALGLLCLWPGQASATHVSCGDTITQDTTLDSDLRDCSTGVRIGADDVTLDLNGHTIDGPNNLNSVGVIGLAPRDSGITIENGTIREFEVAVLLGFSLGTAEGGNVIRDLVLEDNIRTGVAIGGLDNNVLEDITSDNFLSLFNSDSSVVQRVSGQVLLGEFSDHNVVRHSDGALGIFGARGNRVEHNHLTRGMSCTDGERNVIVHNTVANPTQFSTSFERCNDNHIERNSFSGHRTALSLLGDGNRLERNVFVDSEVGLHVSGQANLVERNSSNGNDVGLEIRARGNLVVRNRVAANRIGAEVLGVEHRLERNRFLDNLEDGLVVDGRALGILIAGNSADRNGDDGIDVDTGASTVTRNNADRNGDFGIEAAAGTTDGGGNRAFGNGNPLQCLNVECK